MLVINRSFSDFIFGHTLKTNLNATCVLNHILNRTFPFWKFYGVNQTELSSLSCFDPDQCPDIPEGSEELTNNFDNMNNNTGDTFQYFCNLGKKGKTN